jgi:hypothetical protein
MCEFRIFTVRAFAWRATRISKRVANGTNDTLTSFSANATRKSQLGRSVYLQCPGCGNLVKARSSSRAVGLDSFWNYRRWRARRGCVTMRFCSGRGGRVVEGTRLLIWRTLYRVPRVRIPPSPPPTLRIAQLSLRPPKIRASTPILLSCRWWELKKRISLRKLAI